MEMENVEVGVDVAGMLTSTTAPNKVFKSRAELAQHYKSDWHRYNLKRREAGLAMVREEDFKARLEAAMALRRDGSGGDTKSQGGRDHLKKSKKQQVKGKKGKQMTLGGTGVAAVVKPQVPASIMVACSAAPNDAVENSMETEEHAGTDFAKEGTEGAGDAQGDDSVEQEEGGKDEEDERVVIDPKRSLFDDYKCLTVRENLDRMYRTHGFFVPDAEYLVDMEGFVGYCAEKVKIGRICLYCQRAFKSARACRDHMISTQHTKLRYEQGIDQEEFGVFYDFKEANATFWEGTSDPTAASDQPMHKDQFGGEGNQSIDKDDADEDVGEDGNSGEWEDIDDDEEEDEEEGGLYDGYEEEIARFGLDVTPLGELVFPDGRIVGHRGLARYYKQKFATNRNQTSVTAARQAASERIYKGRVLQLNDYPDESSAQRMSNALALARSGLADSGTRGITVSGRSGGGILVPTSTIGVTSNFTSLSLYRYKAAVRKARRDEAKGQRLQQRSNMNHNRMDKKANRLMNGVSVAHAPR